MILAFRRRQHDGKAGQHHRVAIAITLIEV